MEKISESGIQERLAGLKGWDRLGDMLVKNWQFSSSQRALEFVNAIAGVAQQLEHYPDIVLSYREVRVESSTHSAGGVTEVDFRLASAVDQLATDR